MGKVQAFIISMLLSVSLWAQSAQEHLATYGVSMQVARDFIMDNYGDNLPVVYNTCLQFGVNNDMIAEILQSDIPGLTGAAVSGFFDLKGFDGSALGFTQVTLVADAGADQTVTEGTNVTLSASGSSDSDSQIKSYEWSDEATGTTLSTLSEFSKSDFSVGTHTVNLTVTDDDGDSAMDTVLITIEEELPPEVPEFGEGI